MAYLQPDKEGKVYLPAIRAAKERGEKLVCLTAYDYPTARIVDEAGVDMILVGDSMGNVIHGYGNTIPVSLDEITSACIAVKRGTERAMVVADMPFGTYHISEDESVKQRPAIDEIRRSRSREARRRQQSCSVGQEARERRDPGRRPHRPDAAIRL